MSLTTDAYLDSFPNEEVGFDIDQAEEEYLTYEKRREEADDRDRSLQDQIQGEYNSMEEKLELLDNE